MSKLFIIILLFFSTGSCSCQKSLVGSNKLIQNQLFIDGKKIDISNNFSVSLKDTLGNILNVPVDNNSIDLSKVSDKLKSYEITFGYGQYKLVTDLDTKYIIPTEKTNWIWSIKKNASGTKINQECSLVLEFTESGIGIKWPIECAH